MYRTTDIRLVMLALIACLALFSSRAQAWHEYEHDAIAEHAVALMPDSLPKFFRDGAAGVGHASVDPDMFKLDALKQLKRAEGPEHYFDLERLDGAAVPETRPGMQQLLNKKNLPGFKVGFLPYAIAEWKQRLTVAFAEHRRWPDNAHIRAKCQIYAGILSHYTADLANPLHTTVHFDGRLNEKGESPRTGIHTRVDRLLRKIDMYDSAHVKDIEPEAIETFMPTMVEEIRTSHQRVDRVYALKEQIPALDAPLAKDAKAVSTLARTCLRQATRVTASAFLTAWKDSADLKLPEWISRPKLEAHTPPAPTTQAE